jgi:hypothetical protein
VTAPSSPQKTDPLAKTAPSADVSRAEEKARASSEGQKKPEEAPRNDTVALLEKKTGAKELPGWLAISAIVALSLAAFLSTYLVRTKLATSPAPRDVVTASASSR